MNKKGVRNLFPYESPRLYAGGFTPNLSMVSFRAKDRKPGAEESRASCLNPNPYILYPSSIAGITHAIQQLSGGTGS
jgi:hypothetical protein